MIIKVTYTQKYTLWFDSNWLLFEISTDVLRVCYCLAWHTLLHMCKIEYLLNGALSYVTFCP